MPATKDPSELSQRVFEEALADRLRDRPDAAASSLTTGEIREGVSFERLEALTNRLGLTQETMTRVLGVSERTLQRRKQSGRLSPAESDRFERLLRVHRLALRAFDGDEENARSWLTAPKRALKGETPVEHLDTEPGAQAVTEMLVVIDQTFPA